ncbi:hypothetical protein G4X40_09415 [Rhodococcus sp. D2-41]|uniref:Uncharacterized protein n=1 Tax=Speluncibacter jeojiensis TaxID=2710754 RepID=A0A9X4RCQ5_9ACTN|nr:hypothetical protein [Rhodococcus sp. D2-41]MDG3010369.1 hypothetical protein [Rhodococcus sp. D2-41]MDG3014105.1 hypothetical protein [Corynebacteriales bacterium D3-21]
MGRKKHVAKAKTNAPRGSRRRERGRSSVAVREPEFANVLGPFRDWLRAEAELDGHEDLAVEGALDGLRVMRSADPRFDETAWKAADLDSVLAAVPLGGDEEQLGYEDPAEVLGDVFAPLGLLLGFLFETGRWTGTEQSYLVCAETIDEYLEPDSGLIDLDALDVPEVEQQAELAALAGLPVVLQLDTLLTWIGTGRPVTGEGTLGQQELLEVTRELGVAVESGEAGDVDTLAQSVAEVSEFDLLWSVAEDAELVAVADGTVTRGTGADAWSGQDPGARLELLRAVAARVFAETMLPPADDDGHPYQEADDLAMALVAAAFTDDPAEVGFVDGEALADLSDDERRAFEETVALVKETMLDLEDQGFVRIGETYTVPEPVKPAVHWGLVAAADALSAE